MKVEGEFSYHKQENLRSSVAYFFENLARHITHTPLLLPEAWQATKTTKGFDFTHDDLGAHIEAKGRNGSNPFTFFEDQLKGQRDIVETSFPFGDGIVLAFSYAPSSLDSGKGIFESHGHLLKDVSQFLVENTRTVYAIDFNLLSAIEKRKGTRPYLWEKRYDRNCILIGRRELRDIASHPKRYLKSVGLQKYARSWLGAKGETLPTYFIKTALPGQTPQEFELVPLLPSDSRKRFLKVLNGSVKKL
jgi:hypothetical protein